jgi:hypothetical protein
MDYTVKLYSKAFLDRYEPDGWATATISKDFWNELYENQTGRRFFLRFEREGISKIIAIGSPAEDANRRNREHKVWIPLPFLDQLITPGTGEEMNVQVFSEEAFPEATRIVVRSVDSAVYNSDVRAELERAFTQMGILERHQLIEIPIEALGGYPVDIFISEVEPADLVLCQGDEVAVEFEEPVDAIAPPPPRPPTPQPPPVPSLMIPEEEPRPSTPPGRVLGSDPSVAPPAWRQGLPPPRRR